MLLRQLPRKSAPPNSLVKVLNNFCVVRARIGTSVIDPVESKKKQAFQSLWDVKAESYLEGVMTCAKVSREEWKLFNPDVGEDMQK